MSISTTEPENTWANAILANPIASQTTLKCWHGSTSVEEMKSKLVTLNLFTKCAKKGVLTGIDLNRNAITLDQVNILPPKLGSKLGIFSQSESSILHAALNILPLNLVLSCEFSANQIRAFYMQRLAANLI